jgi:MoxR-like ATPase
MEAVAGIPWTQDAKDCLNSILKESREEGIVPGDRRLCKSKKAAQAFAFLEGDDEVKPEHLAVLSHTLWMDPKEQAKKLFEIVGKIANPSSMKVNSYILESQEIIRNLDLHRADIPKICEDLNKLKEIHKKLSKVKGVRATRGAVHVKDMIGKVAESIVKRTEV